MNGNSHISNINRQAAADLRGARHAPARNHAEAYEASWQTLAHYFKEGVPQRQNYHLRRFMFADGSRVDIQAHEILPDGSGLWQGYEASFYPAPGEHATGEPSGRRYFYGWSDDLSRWTAGSGQHDGPALNQLNFADRWQAVQWRVWRSGDADKRVFVQTGLGTLGTPQPPYQVMALQSAEQALAASWDTQALLFQYGEPVEGNIHLRRRTFADGSRVEIQAYQWFEPASPGPDAGAGANASSSAGLGSGACPSANPGPNPSAERGQDQTSAIPWQGYAARYYASAADDTPWQTAYFYGQGPRRPAQAAARENMANHALWFHWYAWRTGLARPRARSGLPEPINYRQNETFQGMRGFVGSTDRLVQHMAALHPWPDSGLTALAGDGAGAWGGEGAMVSVAR